MAAFSKETTLKERFEMNQMNQLHTWDLDKHTLYARALVKKAKILQRKLRAFSKSKKQGNAEIHTRKDIYKEKNTRSSAYPDRKSNAIHIEQTIESLLLQALGKIDINALLNYKNILLHII